MSSGTGFLVSADGAILTAFHIVDGAKSMKAVDVDGRILAAKVVAAQPDIDMALLEVGLASEVYLPVPKDLECKLGDHVFTLGFPASELLGREPKYADGAISSLTGMRGDRSRLQITVPIQPGSSGGPLVNEQGQAVGVVVSTAAIRNFYRETGALPQNVNFAVRTDLGLSLMRGRSQSAIHPAATRKDAIERARRCVSLVEGPRRRFRSNHCALSGRLCSSARSGLEKSREMGSTSPGETASRASTRRSSMTTTIWLAASTP